ncbi:MAG TPA: hypothetical protein VMV32_08500 [Ignavibacteriaceae bacterium]|nr:hypothetical protein [Ignavibacteriaceae bacterium]
MIKAICKKCGKELEENGAILWSEPDENEKCKKTHLCVECYKEVIEFIEK